MDTMRSGLPSPPIHLANRPLHKGYVVPFFVAWVDGVPDFRIVDTHKLDMCLKFEFCWLCGKPLGSHRVFVVGPMCTVNHVSSEPPSHRVCAEYAATVCPHITKPQAKRRKANMPKNGKLPPGQAVLDNPGVVVLWESTDYRIIKRDKHGGVLMDIGEPVNVEWWTKGRGASRKEAEDGFVQSVSRLRQQVEQMKFTDARQPDVAWLELGESIAEARRWLPPD